MLDLNNASLVAAGKLQGEQKGSPHYVAFTHVRERNAEPRSVHIGPMPDASLTVLPAFLNASDLDLCSRRECL